MEIKILRFAQDDRKGSVQNDMFQTCHSEEALADEESFDSLPKEKNPH